MAWTQSTPGYWKIKALVIPELTNLRNSSSFNKPWILKSSFRRPSCNFSAKDNILRICYITGFAKYGMQETGIQESRNAGMRETRNAGIKHGNDKLNVRVKTQNTKTRNNSQTCIVPSVEPLFLILSFIGIPTKREKTETLLFAYWLPF